LLGVEKVTVTPSFCISFTSAGITGFGPLTVYCVPSFSLPVMAPEVLSTPAVWMPVGVAFTRLMKAE
jgi:hypothetical protein